MKTAVVILNWNTAGFLRRFLPGVLESCGYSRAEGPFAEVIVADSGSTDNSLEVMAAEFPQVRTIPLGANYGFTGGYNRALAQVEAEYFVLLNSDIDAPCGWLEPLVSWMDSHPDCAACGPKLRALRLDSDSKYERSKYFEYAGAAGGELTLLGYPYCRGRVLRHVWEDKGQYDNASPYVKWVTGACLLVRSSIWKELGGLDDRFFAHMEEIDFCWRARLCGYRIAVVPRSVVYHLGGGTLPQSSPFKLKLNFRNSLLMLSKNLPRERGKFCAAVIMALRMVLDRCAELAYLLAFRKDKAKAVSEAYKEYHKLIKDENSN